MGGPGQNGLDRGRRSGPEAVEASPGPGPRRRRASGPDPGGSVPRSL